MVTVVKSARPKKVKCGSCGATLAYVESDVTKKKVCHTGHVETVECITCPACSHTVELS